MLGVVLPCLILLSIHAPEFLSKKLRTRQLSESERVEVFREKHVWPPQWQEENEGYTELMRDREKELMQLPGSHERWENWMQFVSGQMVPKFTHRGFDVVPVPEHVFEKLLKVVEPALEDWDNMALEGKVDVIYGPLLPKFVNARGVEWEIIEDLKDMHEQWAGGIELRPTSAYGIRFYQNGSSLVMHHDKIHTHVISSIIHIAHEYDNDDEPWPIQIEDHFGNFHSVSLEPGQMLFYESAKCLHGRLTQFKGKYYGGVFIHYQPVDKEVWNFQLDDVTYAVPPHWNQGTVEEQGSRWAGQGITIDSRSAIGSPPRIINGKFIHDRKSPYAYFENLTLTQPLEREEEL